MGMKTNGVSSNQVRTRCKLCLEPVRVGEKAEFIADPVGLSHTACIEKRLRQSVEVVSR
jgi:hypothetical protein